MKHDIMVLNGINIDRAKLIDVDHPNGEWILVEFYLPIDNRKVHWVLKTNTKPAYFRQLDWNAKAFTGTQFHIDFVRRHKQTFSNPLIDIFGYVWLSEDEQKNLWQKAMK